MPSSAHVDIASPAVGQCSMALYFVGENPGRCRARCAARTFMKTDTPNRWIIALAGVLMQIALGAVYAWSVFRIPLTQTFGWTISEVTFAFELAILVLGFASFAGGLWMRKSGPRLIAMVAAILYGGGTVLAGLSHNLTMLYLAYGLIGGAGLGLGYIVPVATLIRWFPDRRGMI